MQFEELRLPGAAFQVFRVPSALAVSTPARPSHVTKPNRLWTHRHAILKEVIQRFPPAESILIRHVLGLDLHQIAEGASLVRIESSSAVVSLRETPHDEWLAQSVRWR